MRSWRARLLTSADCHESSVSRAARASNTGSSACASLTVSTVKHLGRDYLHVRVGVERREQLRYDGKPLSGLEEIDRHSLAQFTNEACLQLDLLLGTRDGFQRKLMIPRVARGVENLQRVSMQVEQAREEIVCSHALFYIARLGECSGDVRRSMSEDTRWLEAVSFRDSPIWSAAH
jgi:hypothetical protein